MTVGYECTAEVDLSSQTLLHFTKDLMYRLHDAASLTPIFLFSSPSSTMRCPMDSTLRCINR